MKKIVTFSIGAIGVLTAVSTSSVAQSSVLLLRQS